MAESSAKPNVVSTQELSIPCQIHYLPCIDPETLKQVETAIEPVFYSTEYLDFDQKTRHIRLNRISGAFNWAGNTIPNDAHYWGKHDFLKEPQFQGEHEVNFFRKTNTDLVTFIQTDAWICFIRLRKLLRLFNVFNNFESTINTLTMNAGFPVDPWGTTFEKMHPQQCRCAPCFALREVKKQLEKRSIPSEEVTTAAIIHIRRCMYRVLITGIDRIFETFCNRRFKLVYYFLNDDFDEHYRDIEFEKLCSLVMNDIVALEPIVSLADFNRMLVEIYEGSTDLACSILHKFAVILGPKPRKTMDYVTALNFVTFYIDSFNMVIKMLKWLEGKFRVFNQLTSGWKYRGVEEKLDLKGLILYSLSQLVYQEAEVDDLLLLALQTIEYHELKFKQPLYGPECQVYSDYIQEIYGIFIEAKTLFNRIRDGEGTSKKYRDIIRRLKPFKLPTSSVIDSSMYVNPYRDDQFETPQVFHCTWTDRLTIDRTHAPWKLLYNNKTKILLRLSIDNPADKNRKLAVNVFLGSKSHTDERMKDQYVALYEARLERLDVPLHLPKIKPKEKSSKDLALVKKKRKASFVVRHSRPDKASLYRQRRKVPPIPTLTIGKGNKMNKPSTIQSIEQLLTFALKTGIEGGGFVSEVSGDDKDVYVSITCVDRERRAKMEQDFSLHELMAFIMFWFAKHGCLSDFESQSLHRRKFDCTKAGLRDKANFKDKTVFREKFAWSRAHEDVDGDGFFTESDLPIGLANMTAEEAKRYQKGFEGFLMNDFCNPKRTFAKITSSGICVTQRGEILIAEGTVTNESIKKSGDSVPKKKITLKPMDPKPIAKKTGEKEPEKEKCKDKEKNKEVVTGQKVDTVNTPVASTTDVRATTPTTDENSMNTETDVDKLVQLIEGVHVKMSDPKKAAKKARQKEKKESERQRLADEKCKEEENKKAEELRLLEEERLKEEEEARKREAELKKAKEEEQRKQREAVEQKKEEQRRKKEETERRKAEEKKSKKDAKKQRREQRKEQELSLQQGKEKEVVHLVSGTETVISSKTESKKQDNVQSELTPEMVSEKEIGRIKHEKEKRKREEEEARRLEELQAQERAQANKKNKKKKKKNKQANTTPTVEIVSAGTMGVASKDDMEVKPVGQPLMELLTHAKQRDSAAKGSDDKSNLVTIRKHMDSSVTISMKGKEGESDLVYTLMNGQVYPTSVDGRIRTEEARPLQHSSFVKPTDYSRLPRNTPPEVKNDTGSITFVNQGKPMAYKAASPITHEETGVGEIDLSQLKLPPGITITKVPQHASGIRLDDMNSVQLHNQNYESAKISHVSHNSNTDYHSQARPSSIGGVDSRFNSNVMVVDSRCSSMESPVIGMRSAELAYGANGTRPSSESSIASDRPSSGLDIGCHNGTGHGSYMGRPGYQSAEHLNGRIPASLSSPFTMPSRNDTPSPAWHNEINPSNPGMYQMNNPSRNDRQGYWCSTPGSPVSFPFPNADKESYLRAQDQQFIRPTQNPYSFGDGDPCTTSVTAVNGVASRKEAADYNGVITAAIPTPIYNGVPNSVNMNGSSRIVGSNATGFRPVIETSNGRQTNQWTPWNLRNQGERASPDLQYTTTMSSSQIVGSFPRPIQPDHRLWESNPSQEKPIMNRTVNPYGPIGSNINRRPSNGNNPTNGLGQLGKVSETSGSAESAFWSYNRTF